MGMRNMWMTAKSAIVCRHLELLEVILKTFESSEWLQNMIASDGKLLWGMLRPSCLIFLVNGQYSCPSSSIFCLTWPLLSHSAATGGCCPGSSERWVEWEGWRQGYHQLWNWSTFFWKDCLHAVEQLCPWFYLLNYDPPSQENLLKWLAR